MLTLHVIALNIPYPPNYGGVIDIYYKLLALHRLGVRLILHCYEYERPRAPELECICAEVHYYPRRTGLLANLTLEPYNVAGRRNERLVQRLLQDDTPILFEGLHTCFCIDDPRLAGRVKVFRSCNIEHDYYRAIGQAERHPLRRLFYRLEAWRFRRYLPHAAAADLVAAVSTTDTDALRRLLPASRVAFIPCFHAHDSVSTVPGRSDFILYHAKLSVKENEQAALYLIRHVFPRLAPARCIIAGMNPTPTLLREAACHAHISVEANPTAARMDGLIREAQIHLLVTFQGTGLKLKLLNSLFAGRHVVVNPTMLAGSGLDSLCHIGATPDELVDTCRRLMDVPFRDAELDARRRLLLPAFSNEAQARRLLEMIEGTRIA